MEVRNNVYICPVLHSNTHQGFLFKLAMHVTYGNTHPHKHACHMPIHIPTSMHVTWQYTSPQACMSHGNTHPHKPCMSRGNTHPHKPCMSRGNTHPHKPCMSRGNTHPHKEETMIHRYVCIQWFAEFQKREKRSAVANGRTVDLNLLIRSIPSSD